MSYTALYRKFRPDNFSDVKGQDHIVTTLKNQIKADRIGHAYLFCGTRGTGKTTVAKIFAKAVNCENSSDGNPCNECSTCKAISAGVSMNVIEIDAASNNGVDNIREIRDEVQYSPTEGRYKVYIIDEVHMLSMGAFNALLKTLEEPPAYVIFILATTEAHKIPITILSRCQRYDFRRISVETIQRRLSELMQAEGVEAEEKALHYVAKAGDGSLRDALSLLDQCLAFYMNQKLTYDNVLDVLGAVDTEIFSLMLRTVIQGDTLSAIKQLEALIVTGRDLTQFTVEFTWYMRNLLLVQTSDQVEDILDVSTESRKALQEEASMIEPDILMRYIRIFSELTGQIKYAAQKRVLVEIALIKLTKPSMEQNYDSILNRLAVLENRLENAVVSTIQTVPEMSKKEESDSQEKKMQPAVTEDVQHAVNLIGQVANQLGSPVKNYIQRCRYKAGGENRLILVTDDEMAEMYLKNEEKKEQLEKMLSLQVGKEIRVEIQMMSDTEEKEDVFLTAKENIHMYIEVED